MGNFKKTLKTGAIILILFFLGVICSVKFALPSVGDPEDIKIDLNKNRIDRGKYLANNVCICIDCHSQRDWKLFAGPLKKGTEGMGGEEFNQQLGFPGKFYAKNITPFELQNWTDGEILRAISCGVNKDRIALFPVMPYQHFGQLDREDLYSIIAYLKTLTPIDNKIPESKPDFPMNFIINTIPQKATYSQIPDRKNKIAYGKYIFTAASCSECHTAKDKGQPIVGKELAGGFEFPLPTGGSVYSGNITPDVQTGIGSWTEEKFINKFKFYADSTYKPKPINQGKFNTIMPWMMYCNMTTEDLSALYSYLRTLKPIKNEVVKFKNH